jgi:hypothetical protein
LAACDVLEAMPTHTQPGVAGERAPTAQPAASPAPPPWLQRTSLVLLVATCCYIGILLIVLPWTPLWQENHFLGWLPERWVNWLMSGEARGVVSGLGLLDLWIGLEEAVGPRRRKKITPVKSGGGNA